MEDFISEASSLVWGTGLVFLILFTGAVYTVKLHAVQLKMPRFITGRLKGSKRTSGASQRKTVCMALGAAMGTGNITGVAAALAAGGPGAVFWMWCSAFLGMAVVYAENSLSAAYSGSGVRGPMAYISRGLGSRKLAVLFAAMCVLASLGMGGMVQISSVADAVRTTGNVPEGLIAVTAFAVILAVVSGGVQRIGSAAQILLPAAAIIYAAACIGAISVCAERLPAALSSVFTSAFGLRQAAGGISGYALSRAVTTGIQRGIFSNEAGLGSSPLLHGAAEGSDPYEQSMWSMAEVFTDTIICCSLTALALLCAAPDLSVETALGTVFGSAAGHVTAVLLAVFAFCTVIGWYYCGEEALRYIFRGRSVRAFSVVFSAAASLGAVISTDAVWSLSDIFNGLMAFPNLAALLLLINRVKRYK